MTQAQVADRLGIHLTNYNALENSKRQLTLERMRDLASIFGVKPSEIIEPPPAPQSPMRAVAVKAYVQAGYWTESSEWPRDRWYDVAIPDDPALRGLRLHAAETRGPSMDLRYPEGTVLIFTDIEETGESPVPGHRYVVEREAADGTRETTVKRLDRAGDGRLWLVPESSDPGFSTPIPLEGEDGDTIRIRGRVVWSCQRE